MSQELQMAQSSVWHILCKRIPAAQAEQPWPMVLASQFVSQSTGSHSAGISCTTHELFYLQVVLCGTWSETSVAQSQLTQLWENS
jgi:hypothetical protein